MARRFTRKEVQSHNREGDAVIIIDNVVYDVTRFLEEHPGGAEVLLNNAGRDGSRCFRDVGHTEDAKRWRERFRIGEVAEEDRREVVGPTEVIHESGDERTACGLIAVWAPPLVVGAVAAAVYVYLLP